MFIVVFDQANKTPSQLAENSSIFPFIVMSSIRLIRLLEVFLGKLHVSPIKGSELAVMGRVPNSQSAESSFFCHAPKCH